MFHTCLWNVLLLGTSILSSPESKAQVNYCHSAWSVCPSVVRRKISHFDSFSETAERNSTKLDRMQDLDVFYQVCDCQAYRKNKMTALASDWLRNVGLQLWNRRLEFNESWQKARSQRPLPNLCFKTDRKNKMDALVSDWLSHFRRLLWNHLKEFNETWQEARSQHPLPSLCFWADRKKKQAVMASDWLRHFRLLLWNRRTELSKTV